MNIFIGIDQSMNSTGFVVIDDDCNILYQKIISSDKQENDYIRIKNLGDNILFEIVKYTNDSNQVYCCLEGISFGSNGRGIIQQGSLHNYIRILFHKYSINHIVCTPSELKKFVTGKGNCKKELMLMKIFKKWKIEFENSDLADAYALARYCKMIKEK